MKIYQYSGKLKLSYMDNKKSFTHKTCHILLFAEIMDHTKYKTHI